MTIRYKDVYSEKKAEEIIKDSERIWNDGGYWNCQKADYNPETKEVVIVIK